MKLKSLCVFCGARVPADRNWATAVAEFGALMGQQGIVLVYGGGSVGLMGAVAEGCLGAGGDVIGVMPKHLIALELAHKEISQLIEVSTMHERKAKMAELSDGFIALPGGLGTLEEITEAMTWTQLGLHSKPCGFLNLGGFFDPFVTLLDSMVDVGFVDERHKNGFCIESNAEALLQGLHNWEPVQSKWDRNVGTAGKPPKN